jgi:hypothetical protein
MSARVVVLLAALLLIGGGAAAFLVLPDQAGSRDPAAGGRTEAVDAVGFTDPAPVDPARPSAPPAGESRPEVAPGTRPAEPMLRPKSIDDLKLPAREQGLSGIVRDPKGVEIEGASVELHEDASPTPEESREGALRQQVVTSGNGIFVFDKAFFASPDRFVLRVMHPDYATVVRAIDATRPSPRNLFITLNNGTGVSGTVRSVLAKPLEGATVKVYDLKRVSEDPSGALETSAFADSDGVFVVKSVTSGPKRIVASMPGYATAALPEITLEAAAPTQNIDFVLERGSGIAGRIWAQDGDAVDGALVVARLVPADVDARKAGKTATPPPAPDPTGSIVAAVSAPEAEEESKDARPAPRLKPTARLHNFVLTARSGAGGTFLVEGTEVGTYMLSVSAPGFEKPADKEVTVPGDPVVITLVRKATSPSPEEPRKR